MTYIAFYVVIGMQTPNDILGVPLTLWHNELNDADVENVKRLLALPEFDVNR